MLLSLWSSSIPLLFQVEETLLRKGLHKEGFTSEIFFPLCELLLLSKHNTEALHIAILWINPISWKICFSIDIFNPLSFYVTWMLSLAKYLYSKHSMYGWLLGLQALWDRGWFPVCTLLSRCQHKVQLQQQHSYGFGRHRLWLALSGTMELLLTIPLRKKFPNSPSLQCLRRMEGVLNSITTILERRWVKYATRVSIKEQR